MNTLKQHKYLLTTKRFKLRELKRQDASFLFALNSDPAVMKYVVQEPFTSVEDAGEFAEKYDHYQTYGFGRWLVELHDGTPVGWCGVKWHEDDGFLYLAYRFAKVYWGQGFATECAAACCVWTFENTKYTTITGRAMPDNIASWKVFEKLGFTFDKMAECDAHPSKYYTVDRQNYNKSFLEDFYI